MIFTKEDLIKSPRVFKKNYKGEFKEIITIDDPVISPYPFIYFTCDRDPIPEDSTYSGYPGLIYFWYNTNSTNLFCCTDCSVEGSLVWQEIVMPQNIFNVLNSLGWNINTSRSYSLRNSPSFNTLYTPSTTNDTNVIAVLSLTSTILTAATVQFQVNSTTIGEESLSGIASTTIQTIVCIVPANSQYKLLNSSGTASIVSINEIQL